MMKMEIDLKQDSLPVLHALDSETRIEIINILARRDSTVTELADLLHYSKAIISKHVAILEQAQLVQEMFSPTGDRRQKNLSLKSDSILINLPEKIFPEFHKEDYDVTLGNYFSYHNINPTCGLADKEHVIGTFDQPEVFLSPDRFLATLLWFTSGKVEYLIPNSFIGNRRPELLEISLEISSEFPQSNNNWPSDISFWVNDIKIGTWTVPGNYSDVRGKLTPQWWASDFSQYGTLKHIRVQKTDSGIDGDHMSDVTLEDLHLTDSSTIKFAIGIDQESAHQGGLTIFGRDFGNYTQDIKFSSYYSVRD